MKTVWLNINYCLFVVPLPAFYVLTSITTLKEVHFWGHGPADHVRIKRDICKLYNYAGWGRGIKNPFSDSVCSTICSTRAHSTIACRHYFFRIGYYINMQKKSIYQFLGRGSPSLGSGQGWIFRTLIRPSCRKLRYVSKCSLGPS